MNISTIQTDTSTDHLTVGIVNKFVDVAMILRLQ